VERIEWWTLRDEATRWGIRRQIEAMTACDLRDTVTALLDLADDLSTARPVRVIDVARSDGSVSGRCVSSGCQAEVASKRLGASYREIQTLKREIQRLRTVVVAH
jgi:hypothetical protein